MAEPQGKEPANSSSGSSHAQSSAAAQSVDSSASRTVNEDSVGANVVFSLVLRPRIND